VLQPGLAAPVVDLDYLNPFNDKETEGDKLSIVDLKVRDQSGRHFNVEMQMLARRHLRKRIVYYWSKLHSQQMSEGESYDHLRPTISICFVNEIVFPDPSDYHLCFELRERQHELLYNDDLQLHMLELPKFQKRPQELKTTLDVWLYFLKHAEKLDPDNLPEFLKTVEMNRAVEVLKMVTQSELERHRYEDRLKAQRDALSNRIADRTEGLEEGRKEGRQQGLQQGQLIGRIQTYLEVLARPVTSIDELAAMPMAELEQLAQQLEAQLKK
jgi:predicted transposase/invertase (TIGR01784 family)